MLAPVRLNAPFGLDHILLVPFVASALCQGSLLATWAAASHVTVWKRLGGLVIGAAYLEALVAPDFRREFLGTNTIAIAVTAGALFVLPWLGVRFTRQAELGQPARPEPEGLNFSIRSLMIFTAAAAPALCRGEGLASIWTSTIPADLCFGALFRGSGAGLPVGGARRRPSPAAGPSSLYPFAYTWRLLCLCRKCSHGWLGLRPANHAGVPVGPARVAAHNAVVRLPPYPVAAGLYRSTT